MIDEGTAEPLDQSEPAQPVDGQGAPATSSDTFFDPANLSPELQSQWKSMQGAYTKKMQKLAGAREAAEIVERFNSDPDFARQTIMARAQALGLPIGQSGQRPGMPNQGSSSNMPPQLVDAVKANLSPELQWMAPALAASQWAGMQMALQPIQEQQAQSMRQTRDQQFESLADQLAQKAPGWEEHEDDMDQMLAFLQSPKMTDRRFGSKLELLHRLVAGEGQANATAARRMADAARQHRPAGLPLSQPQANIQEQVMKPKNNQEAWDAAAKFAIASMTKAGIKV